MSTAPLKHEYPCRISIYQPRGLNGSKDIIKYYMGTRKPLTQLTITNEEMRKDKDFVAFQDGNPCIIEVWFFDADAHGYTTMTHDPSKPKQHLHKHYRLKTSGTPSKMTILAVDYLYATRLACTAYTRVGTS